MEVTIRVTRGARPSSCILLTSTLHRQLESTNCGKGAREYDLRTAHLIHRVREHGDHEPHVTDGCRPHMSGGSLCSGDEDDTTHTRAYSHSLQDGHLKRQRIMNTVTRTEASIESGLPSPLTKR